MEETETDVQNSNEDETLMGDLSHHSMKSLHIMQLLISSLTMYNIIHLLWIKMGIFMML